MNKLFKKIVDYSKQNGYNIVFDKDIDFTGEQNNPQFNEWIIQRLFRG